MIAVYSSEILLELEEVVVVVDRVVVPILTWAAHWLVLLFWAGMEWIWVRLVLGAGVGPWASEVVDVV